MAQTRAAPRKAKAIKVSMRQALNSLRALYLVTVEAVRTLLRLVQRPLTHLGDP